MKIDLQMFTPPPGTTKTVLLSPRERKKIAKLSLAEYTRAYFKTGALVRVASYGYDYTLIQETDTMFSIIRRVRSSGYHNTFQMSYKEFADFLARTFDSCILLRIIKLILKNERDAYSVKRSHDIF